MTPCSGAAVQLSGHIVCIYDAVGWSLCPAGAQNIHDAVVLNLFTELGKKVFMTLASGNRRLFLSDVDKKGFHCEASNPI